MFCRVRSKDDAVMMLMTDIEELREKKLLNKAAKFTRMLHKLVMASLIEQSIERDDAQSNASWDSVYLS